MSQRQRLGSYLCLSELGDAMSEPEMNEGLESMCRRDVLYFLANLVHHVDRRASDLDQQRALAEQLLPRRLVSTALKKLRGDNRVAIFPPIVLNVALRALIHSRPEDDGPPRHLAESERRLLGRLILAEADRLNDMQATAPATDDSIEKAVLELTRSDLHSRQYWYLSVYEEAYQVMFRYLPELPPEKLLVDPFEVIRTRVGIAFDDLWAIGAFMSMLMYGQADCPLYPSGLQAGGLKDPSLLDVWFDWWSIELDDALAMAEGDLAIDTGWSFRSFFNRPLLRINPAVIFPMRTSYAVEKAGLNGTVWTVLELLTGTRRMEWLSTVGHAFEAFMLDVLASEINGVSEIMREDDIVQRWGPGKACDALIVYDSRAWLAVEFVYRNPRLATKVYGDYEDLMTDLNKAAVEKFEQVDATMKRGLAAGARPKLLVPLVVVGGQFPLNPATHQALMRELAKASLSVAGSDPRSTRPALMESHDFRVLLHAAARLRKPAFRLVQRWQESTAMNMPFSMWLHGKHPEVPVQRLDAWFDAAKGRVFRDGAEGRGDVLP